MSNGELLLVDGGAHPELAHDIATEMGLGHVEASISRFADGETSVKITDNVREADVFVVQPTGPPVNDNIMNSLLVIDALRRASAGRVTAVMPYFGYARQDRKEASRVPISAKLVTNLFDAAGADRLLSVDLHSHQIQGFTDKPFDHLYARNTLAAAVCGAVDEPIIVAPDVGASKMAKGFARRLETDIAIVDKERIDDRNTNVAAIIGNVAGRNAVIVDDIVSSGSSLIGAAEALKEQGALHVVAAVTHGVLCGDAVKVIEDSNSLDALFITDSLPESVESDKIRRVTIAPLLATAILNIHEGRSVTGLF